MRGVLFLSVALLAGCTTSGDVLPERAVIEPPAIAEAIRIETETNAKSERDAPSGTPWFEVADGNVPIIVTAPHGTRPLREGQHRFADGGGTAAIAIQLNKIAGVTSIYTTYQSPSDPNYYDENAFKDALDRLIKEKRPMMVLDIHGSHAYRPYDVDLGTMDGRSLLGDTKKVTELMEALRAEGLVNISYNYFSASQSETITKFASARGVPAVQVEVNSTWLTPSDGALSAHRFAQLLQGLVRYIGQQEKNKKR